MWHLSAWFCHRWCVCVCVCPTLDFRPARQLLITPTEKSLCFFSHQYSPSFFLFDFLSVRARSSPSSISLFYPHHSFPLSLQLFSVFVLSTFLYNTYSFFLRVSFLLSFSFSGRYQHYLEWKHTSFCPPLNTPSAPFTICTLFFLDIIPSHYSHLFRLFL